MSVAASRAGLYLPVAERTGFASGRSSAPERLSDSAMRLSSIGLSASRSAGVSSAKAGRISMGSPGTPACSSLAVSRQPPRVFIQKMHASDVAVLSRAEKRAADHGIGAGEPEVELLAIVLLQGVEREPEQLGDLPMQRAGGGMVLDQPPQGRGRFMGRPASAHGAFPFSEVSESRWSQVGRADVCLGARHLAARPTSHLPVKIDLSITRIGTSDWIMQNQ